MANRVWAVAERRSAPGGRTRTPLPLQWPVRATILSLATFLFVMLGSQASALASGPPVNTVLPVITSSEPTLEMEVTASNGTWTESPTSYTDEWMLCNHRGEECTATKNDALLESNFLTVEADEGYTIRVKVIAENANGQSSAISEPTKVVPETGAVSEYSTSSGTQPTSIAAGPEGDFWYTEPEVRASGAPPRIRKITPSGTISEVVSFAKGATPSEATTPSEITPGPAGEKTLWFNLSKAGGIQDLAKISETGSVTEYAFPASSTGSGLVAYDGSMWTGLTYWLTGENALAQWSPSGTLTTHTVPGEAVWEVLSVVRGGGLWYANGKEITQYLANGDFKQYATPNEVSSLTSGRREQPWFAIDSNHTVGTLLDNGSIEEYATSEECSHLGRVVGGVKEGSIWFTCATRAGYGAIGRINMKTGKVSMFHVQDPPIAITLGPDGYLWFVEEWGGSVGKLAA